MPTSVADDKSCGISIIGKVTVAQGREKRRTERLVSGILFDALTIYNSRYRFLFSVCRARRREKETRERRHECRREKKRTTKLIAVFVVNGNGDHLLAVKFQVVSSTPNSSLRYLAGRTLMRHNADRMVNNFFVAANGTFREPREKQ